MKTGLGLKYKFKLINAYLALIKFKIKKSLFGFGFANQYIQRVDKLSLVKILRSNGAQIGNNCDIETGQVFHNCMDYKNLIIGENCHIGKNCFFDLRDKIQIMDNVVISMQCTFITHIDMTKSELEKLFPADHKPQIIKSNVYIGVRSTLLMGVEVGEFSFIAANSLVTKNVDSYTMVGGSPARFIKKLDIGIVN